MNIWQISIPRYPHTRAFDTVALCLRESIRELGFESEIVHTPQRGIVLGAHLIASVPEGSIIYNLEQITPESFTLTDTYIEILKNNRVWDYSKRNIEELKKLGIDAVHMPIGYHPVLNKNLPEVYSAPLGIDCLFYGSINSRRQKIIDSLSARYVFNIYGEDLDDIISRSKIILNCHYYETKLFEIVRCSYLLANKKFILSERGLDPYLENSFREGMAFHDAEELPYWYQLYLERPDLRESIAQKGFEIFSKMKQTEYLRNESQSWKR